MMLEKNDTRFHLEGRNGERERGKETRSPGGIDAKERGESRPSKIIFRRITFFRDDRFTPTQYFAFSIRKDD